MKLRPALLASALLLAARLAAAAPPPTTAEGWYSEGQTQYTLGNFDKAVEAFKKGFELETVEQNKPAYLYNIAQAYRQANDCKNAVFFYKRFLALKANDTVKPLAPERKAEVDGWVKDGEACIKQQEDLRKGTPDGTVKPGDDGARKPDVTTTNPPQTGGNPTTTTTAAKPSDQHVATVTTDAGANGNVGIIAPAPAAAPHLLSLRVLGGATIVSAGDLKFPTQATGTLLAGYPLAINDKLSIEVGVALQYTPVPFDDMAGASVTGTMFGAMANGGLRYAVAPKIGVRGDLGLGALVFSGLDATGNPFTQGGVGATGALTMFHARVAASADYLINDNLAVTLTPIAFGYSPAKSGFKDGISSLTSIDFMIGLGYRM